jgi:hypothetical protein
MPDALQQVREAYEAEEVVILVQNQSQKLPMFQLFSSVTILKILIAVRISGVGPELRPFVAVNHRFETGVECGMSAPLSKLSSGGCSQAARFFRKSSYFLVLD